MKKIGEYTCRGSAADGVVERITLFDGKFNTGFRVTSFQVTGNLPANAANDGWATLATEEASATQEWDFDDQRQIGWTGFHTTTFGGGLSAQEILDPDNLIVEDLYFAGWNGVVGGDKVNYLIVLEKYEFTDWTGALAMVRNRSQG